MANLKDVAKQAGLSVNTVSRVLNNRGYISDKTKEKVYRVMKEMNYQPNEMARALFRKKSNMIGLIIPAISHPFFAELTAYLEYYADLKGYKLLLCNSNRNVSKEVDYIEMLKKTRLTPSSWAVPCWMCSIIFTWTCRSSPSTVSSRRIFPWSPRIIWRAGGWLPGY